MTRAIKKRLAKLESAAPHQSSVENEINEYLLRLAIDQHFGNPQVDEYLLAGYSRALGYTDEEHHDAMMNELAGRPTDLDRRRDLANRKLLAKFGATPKTMTKETLRCIEASLWPDYKEHLSAVARDFEESIPRKWIRFGILRSRPA